MILHLMQDYKPKNGGGVIRNSSLLERICEKGVCISIVNLGMEKKRERNENINGVRVVRCCNMFDLLKTAYNEARKNDVKIIHCHNFRFLLFGWLVKVFACRKAQIIAEIHALYRMSFIKEKLAYVLLKNCAAVIVLSNSAKEYLVNERGVKGELVHVIRNGILPTLLEKDLNSEAYRIISKARETYLVAAYFGTFYDWQGVDFLVNTLKLVLEQNSNLFIVMIGDGPRYSALSEIIQENEVSDRVYISKSVTKKQLVALYDIVDIILIPRLKNLSTDTAVPLKVVEAMQFSKCILAGSDNGICEVLNDQNAQLFTSGNQDSFLASLNELTKNEKKRLVLSKHAGVDCNSLFETWDEEAEKLKSVYNSLCDQK